MGVFDKKHFNSEVFGKYLETVPRVKQNAFLKAGILRPRPDLKSMLNEQTGGNFISVPMTGLIGGEPDNYDGNTPITADSLDTYLQSMIVVGRAHSWKEKDFSFDMTGKDFMSEIASQVGNYWDDIDQSTILSTLKGIFATAMPAAHTLDITSADDPKVGPTTLNTAIQHAAGANKKIFTLAIMHSVIATNLENLQVLSYWKETDSNGVQRDVALASWNGRTVLVDDDVPVEGAGTSEDPYKYTTYILGQGAFDYVDAGAKVPNETHRDPMVNGGEDYLITRQRKVFAPKGFSFKQPTTPIVSPSASQLETGARWEVVKNTSGNAISSKAIPFAKIVSLG